MSGKTLYDKIWDSHLVDMDAGTGEALLYIDLHLIHEVTTPQAFDGLAQAGRKVRRPDLTLAVADHNTPTENQAAGLAGVKDVAARTQLEMLSKNVAEHGIEFFPMGDINNGIVHVVGPEQGRRPMVRSVRWLMVLAQARLNMCSRRKRCARAK